MVSQRRLMKCIIGEIVIAQEKKKVALYRRLREMQSHNCELKVKVKGKV